MLRGVAVLVAVALLVVVLPSAHATPAPGAPTPTAAVASAVPTALLAPWSARAGYDPAYPLEVAGVTPTSGEVRVVLGLTPSSLDLYLPPGPGSAGGSSGVGRFAPGAAVAPSLTDYLARFGVTVSDRSSDGFELDAVGSASAIGAAFGTTLESGTFEGQSVRFPATAPTLPGPLAGSVDYVLGLSDGFTHFAFSLTPAPLAAPAQGRTSTLITPSAAHLLYDLSGLYNATGTTKFASGVGIGVVLWGNGYAPADLSTFFGSYYPFGFPSITIVPQPVNGAPAPSATAPSDPSNAPQELTLDLEWAGSEAPGATLYAAYAPDGPSSNAYSPSDADLEKALSTAVGDSGVQVVSMSFGTPDGADLALQAAFAQTFAVATQKGITILAASGDNGGTAKPNCGGGIEPEYPAASPDVLAVGGTAPVESLDALGGVTGFDSEPAWNGSGGGYSAVYSAPSWQEVGSASAPVTSNGHRGIPDVAGPAYDNFFYFNGGERAGRGTSFATPMWAGLVAELDATFGKPLGFLDQRLYFVGAQEEQGHAGPGLVDIASGANCIASATTGWDDVTGWGSPRALTLYRDLAGSFADVTLAAGSTVAPGGSVGASVVVTNATTGLPVAGLTVNFTLAAVAYSGPCGGTLSTGSATTDANGSASAPLSVPACFLGSSALLSVVVASNGYFGANSTTIAVNLAGLAGFLAAIQSYPYNYVAFAVLIGIAVALGYWIGEIRRPRRRRRAAPSPPPPPPPPPTSPPTDPGAPVLMPVVPAGAAGGSPSPSPPALSGAGTGTTSSALPPAAPAVVGAARAPCPSCGTLPTAGARTCAVCGASLL